MNSVSITETIPQFRRKVKRNIREEYCYERGGEDEPKPKLRQRNPESWKQNVRKRNKNKGLEYIKANGEICEKKKLGPPCNCKEKCYLKIGIEACERIFQNFWKLGDHALQNAYIAGCVRIFLPKKCYKKGRIPSRKFFTRNFYVTVNGVDTEVCKQAFLNMHAVSNGRLDRLLKKKQEVGNTGFDERGRHSNKVNKIPLEKIYLVRKHIDSVRQKAGFTGKRKPKKVEILPCLLNIRTMYRNYREEMLLMGLEPVCEYRYRKIFHTDFHLEFGKTVVPKPCNSEVNRISRRHQQQQELEPELEQEQNIEVAKEQEQEIEPVTEPEVKQVQKKVQEKELQQEQECQLQSELQCIPLQHLNQQQEKQINIMPFRCIKKLENCPNLKIQDVNVNMQMNPNFRTFRQFPIYSQFDIQETKDCSERPQDTIYVHSPEVFRIDCSSGYFYPQQNWIFPTINE